MEENFAMNNIFPKSLLHSINDCNSNEKDLYQVRYRRKKWDAKSRGEKTLLGTFRVLENKISSSRDNKKPNFFQLKKQLDFICSRLIQKPLSKNLKNVLLLPTKNYLFQYLLMLWSMIYDVKPNICICIFVSNCRLSFVLEVRRRVLCFSKYHNNLEVLPR